MVPTLLDRKRVCLQCVCVGRRPCTSMESQINKWIIREDELYMSGCTVCLSVSAQWGRFGTSFTPRSPDQSHLCVCLCHSRRSTTKTCSTQLWSCIDLACRQRWMPLLLLSVFRLSVHIGAIFPSDPLFVLLGNKISSWTIWFVLVFIRDWCCMLA